MTAQPTVVLFNRDIRINDHPALATAARESDTIVPLFVIDDALLATGGVAPNRSPLLADALADLRGALRERGGDLVLRRGDPVGEAIALAREISARAIFASADVSSFAQRREARIEEACARERLEFRLFPGATVVPFDELETKTGGYYRVFTPYWRAWVERSRRSVEDAPEQITLPDGLSTGALPSAEEFVTGVRSPNLPAGGEVAARLALEHYARDAVGEYDEIRDDLAADRTSHLSHHLHFGCISPLEAAERLGARPGGDAIVRQLCWRDYYHQLTFNFPRITRDDYRPRSDRWRDDEESFAAWCEGQTGYPIVDAGMRQLRSEGWMHNRARMIVASFLTKHLGIDWRLGAGHFFTWLVDGDVPNNAGNWQWVAGTGTDTRPNRILNPLRQAARFDAAGDYVRRYVPELAELGASEIHEPWKLGPLLLDELRYPQRIIDHESAAHEFRARVSGS